LRDILLDPEMLHEQSVQAHTYCDTHTYCNTHTYCDTHGYRHSCVHARAARDGGRGSCTHVAAATPTTLSGGGIAGIVIATVVLFACSSCAWHYRKRKEHETPPQLRQRRLPLRRAPRALFVRYLCDVCRVVLFKHQLEAIAVLSVMRLRASLGNVHRAHALRSCAARESGTEYTALCPCRNEG
jgi:hypothetical protein